MALDNRDYNLIEKIILFFSKNFLFVFLLSFFRLPAFICEQYAIYRTWYLFNYTTLEQRERKHKRGAKYVQEQVLKWIEGGRKNKMCTARPGWMTLGRRNPAYKKKLTNIEINLKDVVSLDKDRRVLKVEPMVTMGDIYNTVLPHGWTLPVCPEMDDLTIGGLLMSFGGETSSHKYGLFNNVAESYELVLPNGELTTCSRTKDPDLFWSLSSSHGTIGLLTAIELKIIPAQKYVCLNYTPGYSLDEYLKIYYDEIKNPENFFVECLPFSLNTAVIITGKMTPNANGPVHQLHYWYKTLWYKYAEGFLEKGKHTEFMTLKNYYQRHRRAAFWEIESGLSFVHNKLFLFFLGWCLPMKISWTKLLLPEYIKELFDRKHFLEDYCIPFSKLKDLLILTDKEINAYPLWLCPFLPPIEYCPKRAVDEIYSDVGIYGCSKLKNIDSVHAIKTLEKYTLDNNGTLATYGDVYLSREEFGIMFERELYEKVRKKYGCEQAFPDCYDKVSVAAREEKMKNN